jgi:hypothetical protein
LHHGYRVIPRVKRPGRGVDLPSPSSVEVKERIELYLYSPLDLYGLLQGELYKFFLSVHLKTRMSLQTTNSDIYPRDFDKIILFVAVN